MAIDDVGRACGERHALRSFAPISFHSRRWCDYPASRACFVLSLHADPEPCGALRYAPHLTNARPRKKNQRYEARRLEVDDTAVSVAQSPWSGLDIIEAVLLAVIGMRLHVAALLQPVCLDAGCAGGFVFFFDVGLELALGWRV